MIFTTPLPVIVLLACLPLASVYPASEAPPPRKILFLDLWKLDDWDQIELKLGEPKWVPEGTWIDPADPRRGVHSPTVWKDETTGHWRLIHSLRWSPFTLMAAESPDGIAWQPLPVPGIEPEGGKTAPHHIFTLTDGAGGVAYQDPRANDGWRFRIYGRQDGPTAIRRAAADPAHPWHAEATQATGDPANFRHITDAVTLVSKDGLHWELKTGGQWRWDVPGWHPEPPVFAFWNARTTTHTMTVRPGWGDRRQCLRFSSDLTDWTLPELQFQPDPLDTTGPIGMYGLPVHPVGNGAGFVGLLWIFHNASSEPVDSFNRFFGTMDAQLTYSYDGIRFFRGPREPFLRLNPLPEHGCTQIRPCSIVETDSEVRIYSEGHRGAHGRERAEQEQAGETPTGALLLHTLRRDGWTYLRPTGDWGRIQTKPLALWTAAVTINADATYGEVRYQISDEKSRPIPGLTFDECLPLRGSAPLAHPLKWKQADLTAVIGKPIRLEIRLRNAHLYSVEASHHFLDAQDSWQLKAGLPIDATLFDH